MEAACAGGVDKFSRVPSSTFYLVAVPVTATDPLVPARTERVAAVLLGRAVAREQDRGDVGCHAGVVHGAVELVHGARAERVADLWAVEGNPDRGKVLD
ncbi:hypothetical protein D3C73_1370070 [compost metagenome]